MLLELGVDVNRKDDCGRTPLHRARNKNDTDCFLLLLRYGANITATDDRGYLTLEEDSEEEDWLTPFVRP